jgi:CRISPR-associated endonuclease Cas1
MLDVVPDNSSGIADRAAPQDDVGWADRCAYWCQVPTEKRRPGGQPRRQVHKPLVLTGHGMRLNVDNGALVVRNGFTHHPQQQEQWRFFPGDRRMPSRIVIVDGSGGLSFDVMAWLAEQSVPVVRLDWQGRVTAILGGAYGTDSRRVDEQIAAQRSARAVAIAVGLVRKKTVNSIETLKHAIPVSQLLSQTIAKLQNEAEHLAKRPPQSIRVLLGAEGRVAYTYFKAWQGLPIRWKGLGRHPIPDDWHCIGPGQSLNTGKKGKNLNASHPVNAMLNYAYALLESEVRMQIVAEGYDPNIGYLHKPKPDRPALVFDLMEPLRPIVDRKVLEFVQSHTFHPADFVIRSDGVCRLNPEMARQIVHHLIQQTLVIPSLTTLSATSNNTPST